MDLVSNRCLSSRELLLSGNDFERFVFSYIVPLFIFIGITGNILNLTVLLSRTIRERSYMLSYLALNDIFFLTFLLPHSLANYNFFATDHLFRFIYLKYKINLLGLTNWASAAAVWTILFICIERLICVRYPLMIRVYDLDSRLCHFITSLSITTATGLLTFYTHFNYTTIVKKFCGGTQIHALYLPIYAKQWPRNWSNPNPIWLRHVVLYSSRIHELFVVFIPTIVIIVANTLLVVTLNQRRRFFSGKTEGLNDPNAVLSKTEQSIALTVCAIVTCFIVTQLLSEIIMFNGIKAPSGIYSAVAGLLQFHSPVWQQNLLVVINSMVAVGKSLNFVLFCLSSANFRQRLSQEGVACETAGCKGMSDADIKVDDPVCTAWCCLFRNAHDAVCCAKSSRLGLQVHKSLHLEFIHRCHDDCSPFKYS